MAALFTQMLCLKPFSCNIFLSLISGAKVAQYASNNLHKKIVMQPAYGT